jgi:flagellar assembly factor FliW
MAILQTVNFGPVFFDEESVLEFPRGLPGFEERRRFLPVQNPLAAPIVFLQSVECADLCFTTLPVLVVDPQYRLHVQGEDLEKIGLPADRLPRLGEDVLCLAVLSIRETGTTANLLAPVVVNLNNRKAVQAVATESEYSHQQALFAPEAAPCS